MNDYAVGDVVFDPFDGEAGVITRVEGYDIIFILWSDGSYGEYGNSIKIEKANIQLLDIEDKVLSRLKNYRNERISGKQTTLTESDKKLKKSGARTNRRTWFCSTT